MPSTLDIFCCYARADGELLNKLTTHLMPLQRLGLITIWHDTHIEAGREWEEEINKHLNTAQIILLLISPDFMASEYCYSKEMQRAMQRHEDGDASVIPIILRPTFWKGAPFEKLQMLPNSAKAVTIWPNEDEALYNVTERISSVVNDLIIKSSLSEAKALHDDQNYEGALILYEQLLQREADLAPAHLGRGRTLLALERYEEGLDAYAKASQLDPKLVDAFFYLEKAGVLYQLRRYEESLSACDEIIQVDPLFVEGYVGKAEVLFELGRYSEALAACEQAIRFGPDEDGFYGWAGDLLLKLRRFERAIEMYERAIQLEPSETEYYDKKGEVLLGLKRFEEALAVYETLLKVFEDNIVIDEQEDELEYLGKTLLAQVYKYGDKYAQALLGLERYDEALDAYEGFTENYDNTNPNIHYGKGRALFGLERYDEALVAYDEAIRLSGDDVDPELYQDKGAVHERLAKVAFEMAEKRRGEGKNISLFSLLPIELLTELRVVSGHTAAVMSVAMSADGQTLVSGSGDGTIKVWNLHTGQELRTLSGHTSVVMSVAISVDGQTLVSGSDDETIKVWNLHTEQELRTLSGHIFTVYGVAMSADGQTIVSGSYDKTIKAWDLHTGQELRTLSGHTAAVNGVAISADGQTIVSGSGDGTIKVWDLHKWQELRTLSGHTAAVMSVVISADGQTLVSGSGDGAIKVWDLHTGQELRTLSGHTAIIYSVAISADGQTLVSGSEDGTIKV